MRPEPPECPDAKVCQQCGLADAGLVCSPEERLWEERELSLRLRREWVERER